MLSSATKGPHPASTCPCSAPKLQEASCRSPLSHPLHFWALCSYILAGWTVAHVWSGTLFRPPPGTLNGSKCSRKPLMPLPHEPVGRFEAASYPDRLMGDARWAEEGWNYAALLPRHFEWKSGPRGPGRAETG